MTSVTGSTTFGSSAARLRGPVALRPSLAAGLPLSRQRRSPAVYYEIALRQARPPKNLAITPEFGAGGRVFQEEFSAGRARRGAPRSCHRRSHGTRPARACSDRRSARG